jgi:hypothetical protein
LDRATGSPRLFGTKTCPPRAGNLWEYVRWMATAAIMSIFFQIVDLLGNTTDEECPKKGRDLLS